AASPLRRSLSFAFASTTLSSGPVLPRGSSLHWASRFGRSRAVGVARQCWVGWQRTSAKECQRRPEKGKAQAVMSDAVYESWEHKHGDARVGAANHEQTEREQPCARNSITKNQRPISGVQLAAVKFRAKALVCA